MKKHAPTVAALVLAALAALAAVNLPAAEPCVDCASSCELMIVPIYTLLGQPLPEGRWYTWTGNGCYDNSSTACQSRPTWTAPATATWAVYRRPVDIQYNNPDPNGCGNYFRLLDTGGPERVAVEAVVGDIAAGTGGRDVVCATQPETGATK